TLAEVTVRRRDLRQPVPADFAARLRGRRVIDLERRSKYLIWRFDNGVAAILHLGMSGRLKAFRGPVPPAETHDHLGFAFAGRPALTVRFCDPRRFGLATWTDAATLALHPLIEGLGQEPLERDFDGAALWRLLKSRRGPIKAALLDQGMIAGIGNIYACESLFRAGIAPRRRCAAIGRAGADRLAQAIRAVLEDAIAAGGSSLRDHRTPEGGLGYFQHRFAVYDRAGQACPGCTCDPARTGGIRRIVQAGRSTFYCPRRQR
ncbi:MAG: bifunctional DNA-formamidopyrimidine glycosylase/DNA-(apurinic or apyrimidinic site) lyase, partial [Alphaproteobacteria bacterium]|nr:bifunctional DNA-formamidopyrimidine glycosylase/DNA-(apurinic or apyrimidinic site) lyase [Alphaproteobacteria bacterium]